VYKKWSGAGRTKDNCTAELGLGVIGWELGCIHGVYSTTGGLQCRKRHSMFIILVILRFRRIVKIRDFSKFEEWEAHFAAQSSRGREDCRSESCNG
jgi:hypothetical protein